MNVSERIVRALKYVNSMPFSFSMRHYQVFGDATHAMKNAQLMSPESWDALRARHPFFSIEEDREVWLAASEVQVKKDGQDDRLKERAEDVAALFREKGITSVFSVGVGGAALEFQLKRLVPGLAVHCADYAPETVQRLKKVFIEADSVSSFDIMKGDWKAANQDLIGEGGVCLMYRIDASFSDEEWTFIFSSLAAARVMHVLVIPTGTLTMLSIYNRKRRELRWRFSGISKIWSGYLRTQKRFEEHWNSWYESETRQFGGLKGFFLTLRESAGQA